MELAHQPVLGVRLAGRAMRLALALVVLAALGFAIAQAAHSATHAGRCQDLLTSDRPSDYISFEVEGCRARVEPPARAA